MDEQDERPIKKKKKRKRRKKINITDNLLKTSLLPPPPLTRALRDLQTIESISSICNQIKREMTDYQPIESTPVCVPQFDSLVTATKQMNIIQPKAIVPESPENMAFGEPDLQVEEDIILPGCYWGAIGEQTIFNQKTAITNVEQVFNKLKL